VGFDPSVGEQVGESHRLAPTELIEGTETIRLWPVVPLKGDPVTDEIKTAHPDLGSIGTEAMVQRSKLSGWKR
jgi:hypothetical protein